MLFRFSTFVFSSRIFEWIHYLKFEGFFILLCPVVTKGYTARLTTFPPSFYLLISASVARSSEGFPFEHLSSASPMFTFSFCHSCCANPVYISQCWPSPVARDPFGQETMEHLCFSMCVHLPALSLFLSGSSINVYRLVSCFKFFGCSNLPLSLTILGFLRLILTSCNNTTYYFIDYKKYLYTNTNVIYSIFLL